MTHYNISKLTQVVMESLNSLIAILKIILRNKKFSSKKILGQDGFTGELS